MERRLLGNGMERKMEENTARDVETGSETGGEDALVGNVNKLMVSPPGYQGAPRKGHLVFDACFESGNLGRVDYISEFEFDLFIRPDTCNPRFRVWFNFTVENIRETQQQRRLDLLTITNTGESLRSYDFTSQSTSVPQHH
ncbi:cytosolic carboxypeptidase 6 [Cottoperca gobio]|uniref:Cytosolic carboxypeptidase 6 n=1 Tax=Cottoperca gobio TaxID=56716 RepID=A0A6J2PIP4_COTGO|nr:cytosolic carboxypeptidase 6 [Cottoperca gobio]